MTALEVISSSAALSERQWPASLSLKVDRREQGSFLAHVKHLGPLRIQRPFYPEGQDLVHLYVLHPPGGMVSGDDLSIDVTASKGAETLITTPSAGKAYKADSLGQIQKQNIELKANDDSYIEWMPQETIIFDGARCDLNTQISLNQESQSIGWDILCLGRPAAKEQFTHGCVRQHIRIEREQRPIFIERNVFRGGDALLSARWGLQEQPVVGTFFCTSTISDDIVKSLQEKLSQAWQPPHLIGLSQTRDVLVCRYLGPSTEVARNIFTTIWAAIRPEVINREACRPRIWNT